MCKRKKIFFHSPPSCYRASPGTFTLLSLLPDAKRDSWGKAYWSASLLITFSKPWWEQVNPRATVYTCENDTYVGFTVHGGWSSYERYSHRQSALRKYWLSYLEICFSHSLACYFHFKEINLKNFKQISARVPCKCGKIHPADNSQFFHATEYAAVRISLKNTGENTEIFYFTINMEKFMCVTENLNNQFTCLQFLFKN